MEEDKIRIERILGLSVDSNAQFDSESGIVAYSAGNTVVLLDAGSGAVVSHVVVDTRKRLSALQLKGNSFLFAASEDCNYVRVFNWQSGVVKELGPCPNVVCLAVSTLLGLVVTVGADRVVSVWDYRNLFGTSQSRSSLTPSGQQSSRSRKLASSSVACKVSCVSFSPDGSYFVTGGTRHLKFWLLQLGKNECVLTGRPAILGSEHSNADFRDVVADGHATYAVANFDGNASATLCQFDERRFLDKWVQLRTKVANCMTIDNDLIFIGCADGIIRCFRTGKLEFVATLPLPHHLGVQISKVCDVSAVSSHPPGSRFPSIVAIRAPGGKKIFAVYADHSLFAWDVQDVRKVGISHSWLWHSGCIWDLTVTEPSWPQFITCSNDDTLRTWDVVSQNRVNRNLYSSECLDIRYISTKYLDSPLFISHGNGIRCVGMSPRFTCCGDRQGNLRICHTGVPKEIIKIKAHKNELLSIHVWGSLVATASRDGTIGLYNIGQEIDRLALLSEHEGSVTCVKIIQKGSSLLILSCGADKNLIFRHVQCSSSVTSPQVNFEEEDLEVITDATVPCRTPLFDLEVDVSCKHVLVGCNDASIRVYNLSNGKHSKTLRKNKGDETIIKIAMDPSGYYVAASSTDKSVTVFDYYKGDAVATLVGHSELATAVAFTPDLQSIVTTGGDSCVFVWSLTREMIVTMEARNAEKKGRRSRQNTDDSRSMIESANPSPSPVQPEYRFSLGQLPDWAQKHVKGEVTSQTQKTKTKASAVALPQGKWSERVGETGAISIKSFYDSDTVLPIPFTKISQATKEEKTISRTEITVSKIAVMQEQTRKEDVNNSNFEPCEESLREILAGGADEEREEDEESASFYSDVNKSTDGEDLSKPHIKSDTDTDESLGHLQRKHLRSEDPPAYEVMKKKNSELILGLKLRNREMSKSRQQLEKRLEETKRKLQSIGYKSMSQSTNDLSLRGSYRKKEYFGDESDDYGEDDPNGIRRACSLSDLNSISTQHGQSGSSGRRKRSFHRNNHKTKNTNGFDSQSFLTRSASVSVLNSQEGPSDSEPESLPVTPSYMSKTLSSQGKAKFPNAQSQENLRGPDMIGLRVSASEQNLARAGIRGGPVPMARSKLQSPSMKKPQQVHTVGKEMAVVAGVPNDEINMSVANASVDALRKSVDNVLQLRSRLSWEEHEAPITRILEDGLRSVQRNIQDSLDSRPKIITEHEPTVL